MPNIKLNAFITKYNNAVCLNLHFPDWKRAKKANKNKPLVLTGTGGKTLPSPNETIRALASQIAVDYHLRSLNGGDLQQIIAQSSIAIQSITQGMHCSAMTPINRPPCTQAMQCAFDTNRHIILAQQLGLV